MRNWPISTLLTRLGFLLALILGLSACAQMVQPSPQESATGSIAVQEGRVRILALSPAVNPAQLAPARQSLAAAQAAARGGNYVLAERWTLLAQNLLDNVEIRLKETPMEARKAALEQQITDLQSRAAATRQAISQAKAQLAKEGQ